MGGDAWEDSSGGGAVGRGRLAEGLAGQGEAPAANFAGVLVKPVVGRMPAGLIVLQQHELIVHVTRMAAGCDNLFMPARPRGGNLVARVGRGGTSGIKHGAESVETWEAKATGPTLERAMRETLESDAITQALQIIDRSLGTLHRRELVSTAEMSDILLDMRSVLVAAELEIDLEKTPAGAAN